MLNSKKLIVGNIHWSVFILPFGFTFLSLPMIFGMVKNFLAIVYFLIFNLPLLFKFLEYKTTSYILSEQSLIVEKGIFLKTKNEIPIIKINEIEVEQNIFQRLFSAGNIKIYTGNDNCIVLNSIAEVEKFNNELSKLIKGPSFSR